MKPGQAYLLRSCLLFESWTVGSCRFQIHLCGHSCMRNEPWIHTQSVTKFLPAQFPWIWCKCLLRHLIHSKIFNLTKCRDVLLEYSLLIRHSGMSIKFDTSRPVSRVVFWSLSCYNELKLTTNRFTGRTLHGLLIQMQNISLRSSGMRRKQNFEITFRFLSFPLFSLFLPHFFFYCWAFSRLHFGGNSF